MIENMSKEFQRKLEMLSYIRRRDVLEDLAQKYNLPKSGDIEELRKRLAETVPLEKIEEIYEKFEDAGNVTIHLFRFNRDHIINLKDDNKLLELLKDSGLEDVFRKKKDVKLTSESQIVFIDTINGKIKIKLEARGETITKRDAETRKIISFSPLISSVAFIHTDSGLVEVRVRNRRYAKRICDKLAEIFNNREDYQQIDFNEEELEEIITWTTTLRNATIKPLSGTISSLRITAAQGSDLRNEEKYREIEKIIGDSIRTGVYVQYEHTFFDNKKLRVGFQINSQQGKIFFKSYVNEEVIDYVLSKIKEIKGL